MLKALVLGSEGFIGKHLTQFLQAKQYDVYGCDLFETSSISGYNYFKVSRLSPEWDEIFSENVFDFCINAAGSGNVPYSMTHPLIDFEANTLDTIRILEAIRKFNKACKYLHISSAAVYGNPEQLPIHEESSKKPMSPYGWHKLMAEQICKEYYSIYKIPVTITRPFSVYGEGLRKQLLWDVCGKLKRDDNILLYGTGNESRDFIHVEDLVRLIDCIIQNSTFQGDVYNAASGIESTIREVANVFEQYYPGKKKIDFSGETRAGDPVNWCSDIQKAKDLGYQPTIDLKKGITRYIDWYHSIR